MTSGRLITGGLVLLLALLPATAPVLAAPHFHPRIMVVQNDHKNQKNNGGISLDQAIAKARKSDKDKVLSAETIQKNGRKTYRIKILTKNGRVKRTLIDARTGKKL